MNVEKFIKNEAKESLKGNWYKSILAVFLLLTVPLLVFVVIEMAYSMLGDTESVSEALKSSTLSAVFFVTFNLLAVACCLAMSPIYMGFTKFFSRIAADKKSDVSDLFYYFNSKENYIDSFKFITNIIVRYVLILIVCVLPALCVYGSAEDSDDSFITGVSAVLGFCGLVIWFLFVHRYAFAVMLYTHYGKSAKESMQTGAAIAKKGAKQLRKLSLSFTGWLLLNYLVLQFVYLYPYMTCSYFVSAKYLIEQHEKETALYAQNMQAMAPVQAVPVNTGTAFIPERNTAEVTPVNKNTTDVSEENKAENADEVNTSVFANANYTSPVSIEDVSAETEALAESELAETAKSALSLAKEGAVDSDLTV